MTTRKRAASTAVPQVPAGGTVLCWPPARDERCALFAVDVAARTMARLPTEPAFDDLTVQDVGGRLWVSGTDRARGTPAVAMSVDRGRTWIPHVLDPCKAQRCAPPELATADGRTVYATLHDGRRWVVHRGTDNADWRRVDGGQLPDGEAPGWSFVAADGTHVVCVPLAEQRPVLGTRHRRNLPAGDARRAAGPRRPGRPYPRRLVLHARLRLTVRGLRIDRRPALVDPDQPLKTRKRRGT